MVAQGLTRDCLSARDACTTEIRFFAINYVINGYKQKFVDLTNVLRSFPSVYELMACYDVLRVEGKKKYDGEPGEQGTNKAQAKEWKKVAHAGPLPNLDVARATDALAFHDEIAAAVAKNRGDPAYHDSGYKIIPMIGVGQPTMQSIVMDRGRLVGRECPPPSVEAPLEGGDGRVPSRSRRRRLKSSASIANRSLLSSIALCRTIRNCSMIWWNASPKCRPTSHAGVLPDQRRTPICA